MDKHSEQIESANKRIVELASMAGYFASQLQLGDLLKVKAETPEWFVIHDFVGWCDQVQRTHSQDKPADWTAARARYQLSNATMHDLALRSRSVAALVKADGTARQREGYTKAKRWLRELLAVFRELLKRVEQRDAAGEAAKLDRAKARRVTRKASAAVRKRSKRRAKR
jgi:hypothetical protein